MTSDIPHTANSRRLQANSGCTQARAAGVRVGRQSTERRVRTADAMGSQFEHMTPSKQAVPASKQYEALFANDCVSQRLDSAHNEDAGFMQYGHFSQAHCPPGQALFSLYATPRTLERTFHHRHAKPLCGVASALGGAIMDLPQVIPVNPWLVPEGGVAALPGGGGSSSSSGGGVSPAAQLLVHPQSGTTEAEHLRKFGERYATGAQAIDLTVVPTSSVDLAPAAEAGHPVESARVVTSKIPELTQSYALSKNHLLVNQSTHGAHPAPTPKVMAFSTTNHWTPSSSPLFTPSKAPTAR